MRSLLPDFTPAAENSAFRRLLIGGTLSSLGGAMTTFAVTLQIWDMTRSSFAVGAIGFTCVPVLLVGLVGGSIADRVDRRALLLVTCVGACLVSALLAVQAYGGFGQLWLLYLLVTIDELIAAIAGPASRAMIPRLVGPDRLRAAITLRTLTGRIVMLAGPALAGVVAGAWDLKTCYLIDAISFAGAFYGRFGLPAMPAQTALSAAVLAEAGGRGRRTMVSIAEGLRYIRRTPVLFAAFLTDLDAMLLGLPIALFPALNAEHFGGRPQTLGLLTTAVGVGGIITAVLSGPAARVTRNGLGMLAGTFVWGAGIAVFGFTRSLPLGLLALACAGAADTMTVTLRSAMVQTATPEELRGRVSSVEYVIGASAGGGLGNVESGTVAALTNPVFSAVSGGIACIAVAVAIGLAIPSFARYNAREAKPAAEPTAVAASPS
jgi:MFS family permease